MEKRKTVEPVVNEGLCTGCGTCVAICPKDAVEMEIDHHQQLYVPRVRREKCNECGLCFDTCPGLPFDFKQLNLDIFGKEPEDVLLGNYLNCYSGYATDYDIRYNSASGGLVTALLIAALEQKLVDGALVTRFREGKPLEPQPFIARTREEILSAARSKYCPVPANQALKGILNAQKGERFAVVGLPCHIHGIRRAEAKNKILRERIVLHLGLWCTSTSTFSLIDLLLQKYGVNKEDVAEFGFRGYGWPGKAAIKTKDGASKFVPLRKWLPWHSPGFFVHPRCSICPDAFAEFADISFGDAWHSRFAEDKIGRSIIITRNEMAEQLLANMTSQGVMNLERIEPREIVKSQPLMIYRKKKSLAARRRLFRRDAKSYGYFLDSDAPDYIWAIYQHYYSSFVSRYLYPSGVLKHIPVEFARLGRSPMFVISYLQMKRVIRKYY